MADISSASVPRPPLALRVAVTGARALAPDAVDRVRPLVADILGLIAKEMTQLAENPAAKPVYSAAAAATAPLALRLLSPLAEGSDRLVAEEALKAGYQLHAPLPFAQAEYETDFPESVDAFRSLLARAEMLELDGGRGALQNESYREIGRLVVRNCDLLIAIWDGERERGIGGVAEIVRFAVVARVPVWWIDSTGANLPRFIDDPLKLRNPSLAAAGESAAKSVARYLERTILPPRFAESERSGVFGFVAHLLSRLFAHDGSPLIDYLGEKPLAPSFLWRAYGRMMEIVSPKSAGLSATGPVQIRTEHSPLERWWGALYASADKFSIDYGDRYRSSYVLIAILAFVAVNAAAFGTGLRHNYEFLFGALEISALAGIAALVLANHIYRWHEKWISYRLLAELCRKQSVLSLIGQSLPASEVVQMALDAVEEKEGGETVGETLPREAWVAWYYTAASRAAPFLTGSFAAANACARTTALSLADEQAAYHHTRRARNKAASRRIGHLGEICFLLTVLVVGVKVYSLFGNPTTVVKWSTMLGTCLSAASGAFVGVRAYSEFPLLVQQSTHMLRIMKEAKAELGAIEIDQPLASRELGRTMHGLAISMMRDVSGWMQLFRIKALEAG